MAVAFDRAKFMFAAWLADQHALSVQARTSITWPANTSTRTVGPSGNINIARPVWIDALNYVDPGSSPETEVSMGPMDRDSYAAQSIKALQSGLPMQFFYQTGNDSALGTLFIWPQPTQTLTLYFYTPQGMAVPTTLDDLITGPQGFEEATVYQLAERLLTPFAVNDQGRVERILRNSLAAFARMKRPNIQPGLLGVDTALIPSTGGGYNILSDNQANYGGR